MVVKFLFIYVLYFKILSVLVICLYKEDFDVWLILLILIWVVICFNKFDLINLIFKFWKFLVVMVWYMVFFNWLIIYFFIIGIRVNFIFLELVCFLINECFKRDLIIFNMFGFFLWNINRYFILLSVRGFLFIVN